MSQTDSDALFSSLDLEDLPPLAQPDGVQRLVASFNRIRSLPTSFPAQLPSLLRLDLSHNVITELPRLAALAPALQVINISHNCLTGLDFISGCENVRELWCNGNDLSSLPLTANALSTLPNLRLLICHDNPCLPEADTADSTGKDNGDCGPSALLLIRCCPELRVLVARSPSLRIRRDKSTVEDVSQGTGRRRGISTGNGKEGDTKQQLASKSPARGRARIAAAPFVGQVDIGDGSDVSVSSIVASGCMLRVTPDLVSKASAWYGSSNGQAFIKQCKVDEEARRRAKTAAEAAADGNGDAVAPANPRPRIPLSQVQHKVPSRVSAPQAARGSGKAAVAAVARSRSASSAPASHPHPAAVEAPDSATGRDDDVDGNILGDLTRDTTVAGDSADGDAAATGHSIDGGGGSSVAGDTSAAGAAAGAPVAPPTPKPKSTKQPSGSQPATTSDTTSRTSSGILAAVSSLPDLSFMAAGGRGNSSGGGGDGGGNDASTSAAGLRRAVSSLSSHGAASSNRHVGPRKPISSSGGGSTKAASDPDAVRLMRGAVRGSPCILTRPSVLKVTESGTLEPLMMPHDSDGGGGDGGFMMTADGTIKPYGTVDASSQVMAVRCKADGTLQIRWPNGAMAVEVSLDDRVRQALAKWQLQSTDRVADAPALPVPYCITAYPREASSKARTLAVAIDGLGAGTVCSSTGVTLAVIQEDGSGHHTDAKGGSAGASILRSWDGHGRITYTAAAGLGLGGKGFADTDLNVPMMQRSTSAPGAASAEGSVPPASTKLDAPTTAPASGSAAARSANSGPTVATGDGATTADDSAALASDICFESPTEKPDVSISNAKATIAAALAAAEASNAAVAAIKRTRALLSKSGSVADNKPEPDVPMGSDPRKAKVVDEAIMRSALIRLVAAGSAGASFDLSGLDDHSGTGSAGGSDDKQRPLHLPKHLRSCPAYHGAGGVAWPLGQHLGVVLLFGRDRHAVMSGGGDDGEAGGPAAAAGGSGGHEVIVVLACGGVRVAVKQRPAPVIDPLQAQAMGSVSTVASQ